MNPISKPPGGRPASNPEGLTCSEGQVEDLLSEGESTEEDGEEEKTTQKPPKQDSSPRKTGTAGTPKHRDK